MSEEAVDRGVAVGLEIEDRDPGAAAPGPTFTLPLTLAHLHNCIP